MWLKRLKLLWFMSLFEAQRFRAFPFEVVASVFSRILESALFITFWLLVGTFSTSADIVPSDVIGYYMIISGLVPFFFSGFGIGSETIKLIKGGELNQILIRPINPILYPWAMRTGKNSINLIFGLLQIILGIIIAGGLSLKSLPFLLPVLINTFLINFAFNLILGSIGFYLIEAGGVKNAFLHVARLGRGELIPLYLMPASVATALQFTPFPASQYHLTILLQGNRLPSWGSVLLGMVWGVSLLYVAIKIWSKGLRKYEAVGI